MSHYSFKWETNVSYYHGEITEERKLELETFLFRYSHALNLVQQGVAEIIFVDETWENLLSTLGKGFFFNSLFAWPSSVHFLHWKKCVRLPLWQSLRYT